MHQSCLVAHAGQVAEQGPPSFLSAFQTSNPLMVEGCPHGLGAKPRSDQALELAMIGFKPVVEALNLMVLNVGTKLVLLLLGGAGQTTGSCLVGVDGH